MPASPTTVRAWRDNNPLNIRPLPGGQAWVGQSGIDRQGSSAGYAIFSSRAYGWRTAYTLLRNYWLLHQLHTVRGICHRWAPPADNNPTDAYVSTVCALTGYGPDLILDMTDPDTLRCMGDAMVVMESGHLPWPEADKTEALAMLMGTYTPPTAPPIAPPVVHPAPAPVETTADELNQGVLGGLQDNIADDLNQRELDRLHKIGGTA